MDDRRPAPEDLCRLVEGSLPPGAVLEVDWYAFDFHEWRFRIRWFGRLFVLRIPLNHWEDNRAELVSLCAAFGAPRPEATLGGSRFNLSLERRVPDDSTRYEFSLYFEPSEEPRRLTVVVGGSAGGVLAARARKRDEEALKLSAALWLLKDTVDQKTGVGEIAIDPFRVDSLLARRRVPDEGVREYASLKLYQTYQVAGKPIAVGFGEIDFGYLGISEGDFLRAVMLKDGDDWSVKALSLTPEKGLLARLDRESSRLVRDGPPRAGPMRQTGKDLFVSHASEDKESFVRPLVDALRSADVTVWFDEYELVLGDRLREKIDDGLRNSRHGLVVLSHNFFRKPWPKSELDGLFSLMDRDRRIMPIWHGLTVDEVRTYSPTLAGLVSAKSSEGIDKIVRDVTKALGRASAERGGTIAQGSNEDSRRPVSPGGASRPPAALSFSFILQEISKSLHRYDLRVSVTLHVPPDQGRFRLVLWWPAVVRISRLVDFEEGGERTLEGSKYRELRLSIERRVFPGETTEIVGLDFGRNTTLEYEIDNAIHEDLEKAPNDLLYELFLEDHLPVQGRIPFASLNKF